MALASRTEVKAALNITDTDSDAQIDALLDPMSALIELEASRKFTPQEYTEYHPGGEPTIALRNYPVASGGSPAMVVTDLVTSETLAATDYELDATRGLLRRLPRGSQWARARLDQILYLREATPSMRWKIEYTAGEVPEDIKLALYLAIGANLDRTASSSGGGGAVGGIIAEKDGDYSYQRAASTASTSSATSLSASGLPATAAAIARRYAAGVFI